MGPHLVPKAVYFRVFAALIILTAITVAVAFMDLGFMNNIIMLTIAVGKAVLVILYFMHVRYSTRLTMLFVGAGFFWLLILFAFTFSDYLTRGTLSQPVF